MKTDFGKKRKVTCIALDLDQTTLNHQGRLSERNRQAIESAIRKGVQIVIASGRAVSALPDDICNINEIRYAITSNGAAVYDLHTKECLKQYKMTGDSIEKILHYTKNLEVAYETFINGQAYGQKEYVEDPVRFGASPMAIPYIQSTRKPVTNIRDFLLDYKEQIESIDVVVKDENLKKKLWKVFEENISDIYVTSSVQQLLEISYQKSGKHSGAAYILEYLGLSREGLAAFGDGDNDAELLKFAEIGIAMENASDACKEAADAVTLSNDADGVAYWIEKLLRV
ncbi:Cof-type HAD-IIB family hydrolase [Faecalicatena contorta]|uniref:Cof-type HAD-IIB family hydrolase n=1 Tax=Lachnospiraceae TaxID=186803 RepID=UPI001F2368A2|nr:Cof-type HAD-IIB family hydrolase [Faecalicatena contorta]MCF2668120.1 HAD family phosphatase [Faecalicatena contorta]